jgi:DNA-binding PucR family transcriptional regulator
MVAMAIADEFQGAFAEPVEPSEDQRPQVWALLPAAAVSPGGEPRPPGAIDEAAKRLAARMRQYGAVGISRFHADPVELTRAIDEAQLMLDVARRVESPSGDEIVDGTYKLLFRLLASHPDELQSYHETTIAPLVRHDDQYRTDLVRTLETYLGTNCNMNTTAELIFAHRHTVAHRLERIRELTGLDATTNEDRERLGLGLKIHRLTA